MASPTVRYLLQLIQWLSSGFSKKLFTALALIVGLVWMYRRVQAAQAAERRMRALAGRLPFNAHAAAAAAAAAAGGGGAASFSARRNNAAEAELRKLSPAERYLSDAGSKNKRQSVCITVTPANGVVFTSDVPLTVRGDVVPILKSLAQHTNLYLIAVEADKQRQGEIIDALKTAGLFDAGLKEHRVLFCTTRSGKTAIVRHIEPNLFCDDDLQTLEKLKPFIDDVKHIGSAGRDGATSESTAQGSAAASSSSATTAAVQSFPSLAAFFAAK